MWPTIYCSNLERRNILRDGDWIKENWTMLKGSLSIAFAENRKSGNFADKDTDEQEKKFGSMLSAKGGRIIPRATISVILWC